MVKTRDLKKLGVQEIVVDVISQLADPHIPPAQKPEAWRQIADAHFPSNHYPPLNSTLETAYSETLLANLSPSSGRLDAGALTSLWPLSSNMTFCSKSASPKCLLDEKMHFIESITFLRTLIITKSSFLGLGPAEAREGDLTVVLFGGDVPFVLRQMDVGGEFLLVGEGYVHGIMDGGGLLVAADGARRERSRALHGKVGVMVETSGTESFLEREREEGEEEEDGSWKDLSADVLGKMAAEGWDGTLSIRL